MCHSSRSELPCPLCAVSSPRTGSTSWMIRPDCSVDHPNGSPSSAASSTKKTSSRTVEDGSGCCDQCGGVGPIASSSTGSPLTTTPAVVSCSSNDRRKSTRPSGSPVARLAAWNRKSVSEAVANCFRTRATRRSIRSSSPPSTR
ncbi:hypothetical protein ACFQ1I_39535 [Kitasatospora arboriphila]